MGYFLTLTAPGHREHLRWYQGKRPARRGVCECHQHGLGLGAWNGQESACWNRLRTAIARGVDVEFAGSVETQKRGALHRHVVLFTTAPLLHEEVQALALAAGYGCVLDLEPLDSVRKAAKYLSKYVTKASADRALVPWRKEVVDRATGELLVQRRPTYRLWSSSHGWGITMRMIREAHGVQARARARYLGELAELLADDVGAGSVQRAEGAALGPP